MSEPPNSSAHMGVRLHGAETGACNVSDRTLRDSTLFKRARDLPGHSDMTVAQVAELVGCFGARAFRRAFKRWSGVLPNEFREAQR